MKKALVAGFGFYWDVAEHIDNGRDPGPLANPAHYFILAGLFAASFGVLLGFPVLRLRGDYLAIVTLGFGEMVRIVLINWYKLTKGPNGVSGIPSFTALITTLREFVICSRASPTFQAATSPHSTCRAIATTARSPRSSWCASRKPCLVSPWIRIETSKTVPARTP